MQNTQYTTMRDNRLPYNTTQCYATHRARNMHNQCFNPCGGVCHGNKRRSHPATATMVVASPATTTPACRETARHATSETKICTIQNATNAATPTPSHQRRIGNPRPRVTNDVLATRDRESPARDRLVRHLDHAPSHQRPLIPRYPVQRAAS